jgi:anti-sigma factor RsiW
MIEDNSPVTEDELHAYVDGELPADRRLTVEAWLKSHADDAARVAAWQAQAEMIHARYGGTIREPVPARLALDRIARQRRSWSRLVAAAVILAFLAGGAAGWFGRGLINNERISPSTMTAEALEAYKLYVVEVRHPVEVPGAEANHLVRWLSKRLDYELRAPDLESLGLKLVGGRLLPGPAGQPAAFFMYEGPSGERFTLYCARSKAPQTALRYSSAGQVAAVYWVDGNINYVISGPADHARLSKVAQTAYEQIDRNPRAKDRS